MGEQNGSVWQTLSPFVFLLGIVVFLGSILWFLVALIQGSDPFRAIATNAVGAGVMMVWAAKDTLSDPDSEVATVGGATGTALLLYGAYLVLAGVTITATGLLFHERANLGLWYIGLAIVATIVGFLIFPTEAVIEDGTDDEDQTVRPADEGVDGTDTADGDFSHGADSESSVEADSESSGEPDRDSSEVVENAQSGDTDPEPIQQDEEAATSDDAGPDPPADDEPA